MKKKYNPAPGAYPTMITPYNTDGSVDYGAVKALTEWYWRQGCDGIFASCQSSEIHKLGLSDRAGLAKTVKDVSNRLAASDKSRPPMTICASGHISDSFIDQRYELEAVADTGIDSLILISNRINIENTGDDAFIAGLSELLSVLPDIPLGVYECPRPYKRLLTPAIIDFIVKSGRFAFIKDTCCDAAEIDRRIKQIAAATTDGIKPFLFNANAQTLYETLLSGCAGYCGVMCNFHPALYVWLCRNFKTMPEISRLVASFLSTAAFIEGLTYPSIAKYHLNKAGITMNLSSRTCDESRMTDYERMCVDNMDTVAEYFENLIGDDGNE